MVERVGRRVGKWVVCALALGFTSGAFAEKQWNIEGGEVKVIFDTAQMETVGLTVAVSGDKSDPTTPVSAFDVGSDSVLILDVDAVSFRPFFSGELRLGGSFLFASPSSKVAVKQLAIRPGAADSVDRWEAFDAAKPVGGALLDLGAVKVGFSSVNRAVHWETAQLTVTPALAQLLGNPNLAGEVIGEMQGTAFLTGDADLDLAGFGAAPIHEETEAHVLDDGTIAGGNNGTVCACPPYVSGEPYPPPTGCNPIGPDVIVGVIVDLSNYTAESGIEAFAVGTTSCNIGSSNLQWVDNTPNIPVIGQNIFRLKGGRMEQIGQGWLKYAFTALSHNDCGCHNGSTTPGACGLPGGSVLSVGCSDPYCCGLNGNQNNLGPKYQINAYTGSHPSSPANPPFTGSTPRRIQVKISDIDPMQNGGGIYFAEGQYVAPDDASAGDTNPATGNHFNNASYRQIVINGTGSVWNAALTAAQTQREQPAIRAWKDTDSLVNESDIRIPGEGLLILASKATDLGNGLWHYEYALQNLNSDRSVGSFSIPLAADIMVQNVGFHDVDYHSGETQNGTDWTPTVTSTSITWATTPHSVNPDANALRWGTLYNFRFDADRAPYRVEATIGLFKPGTPGLVTTSADGPLLCVPEDCVDTNPCTTDSCDGAGCQFVNNSNACDDGEVCTRNDTCSAGSCVGTPATVYYADVYPALGDGEVNLDDILCGLDGFANYQNCAQGDVQPCPPDNDGVIDLDDITAILDTFAGFPSCPDPCPP